MNDYDIINAKNNKHDRKNEIMKKLSKKFLYFAKSILEDVCKDYTDIFGFENENGNVIIFTNKN